MSVGLLGAWWLERRARRLGAIALLSTTMAAFCLVTAHSFALCGEVLSSKQFGLALARLYRPGDRVIAVGDFETANSVNFYTAMPLEVFQGRAAVLEWGLRYPDAPQRVLDREDLIARWRGEGRVFVLTPDALLAELPIDGRALVLGSAGRTLVCNRPVATAPAPRRRAEGARPGVGRNPRNSRTGS